MRDQNSTSGKAIMESARTVILMFFLLLENDLELFEGSGFLLIL